jgi:hypothetical protein
MGDIKNILGVSGESGINKLSQPGIPHFPVPLFKITKNYRMRVLGNRDQTMTLTVTQAGKDSARALELANGKEFSRWEDEWELVTTVIEQIGMSES